MRCRFTLIELLVVVAIIGILTSILMPSLMKARDKGYQAVCFSNMKQLAIAVQLYVGDNDSWYMGNYKDSTNFSDDSSWHYKLRDPLGLTMGTGNKGQYSEKIPNVLQCPKEPENYKQGSVRTWCSYQFTKRRGDNNQNNPGIVVSNYGGGKRQDTVVYPGETVAATEQHQRGFINVVGGSTAESEHYNLFEGAPAYNPLIYPHGKYKMQILWVDGHVSFTHRMTIFDTPENVSKSNPQNTLWDSDRD
jgi:prepilin-type N-terminal cleavage/methylation domain-containing protein/prepilin-type processing-associated H-X9-DG protein